jgi:NADH-quinone oxidoreductase subunit L
MNALYLTILFPLLGYVILAFSRGRLSENVSAVIGVGSIGLAALTTLNAGFEFLTQPVTGTAFTQHLWTWMQIDGFAPAFSLRLDGLSLTLLGVVTGVGFFIHLFASWYMRGEDGYQRFFSYMNLFVAAMLCLVLGDNLLMLYLGWEGVGLCSFLLIGFYYKNPANGLAARKAFVVTRVGDVFLAIGLFILYREFGTLHIQDILTRAPEVWAQGSYWVTAATLLLLGGAVGKSAQLPLQTWLADAMAGPTPVSALIHAATMVTAGVYLIARTHPLFLLAPDVLHLVGVIGAATLLMSGFAALVQTDIKRILAYSTMSQIGYMFLALGVGAWQASVFHLMTHAFFKALLFLSAGSIIVALHHEQNIFKMGGLRKSMPLVYACFLIGGAALAAVPFIDAGFYSKDRILWEAFATGHTDLFIAGIVGAFLTSLYTFRLIFVVFHGKAQTEAHAGHGMAHHLPLLVLMVLSTFVGAWITPPLNGVLPATVIPEAMESSHHTIEILAAVVALSGIALAALLFLGERRFITVLANSAIGRPVSKLWLNAWGFDWFYDRVFVRPFMFLVRINHHDIADRGVGLITGVLMKAHALSSQTQTGRLRWYAVSMAGGAVLVLAALVLI